MLDHPEVTGRNHEHTGQPQKICANILIKLILDLWRMNDAAVSFPLTLMLLTGYVLVIYPCKLEIYNWYGMSTTALISGQMLTHRYKKPMEIPR